MSDDRPNSVDRTRFESALARGLPGDVRPSSPCPDAETLAAFFEDSISAADRRDLESHTASCLRCQNHLAALVRTASVEDDLFRAEPRSRIGWRWLAPLATTAVVLVAVWAIDPTSVRESNEIAQSRPMLADGDVAEDVQESSASEADLLRPELQNVPAEPLPRTELEEVDAPAAAPARGEQRLDQSSSLARVAAPLRERSADLTDALLIRSADETATWRVTPAGVDLSTDEGLTWTRRRSSVDLEVSAGTAPSGQVCWLVGSIGSDGAILRTIDGGTSWDQITPPTDGDLVGIQATDGQTAVVSFGDGRQFGSDDGGVSWTAR